MSVFLTNLADLAHLSFLFHFKGHLPGIFFEAALKIKRIG